MSEVPTPIVILSDEADASHVGAAMHALRAGALAVVARPGRRGHDPADLACQQCISTIKTMARVKVIRQWRWPDRPAEAPAAASAGTRTRIIAIAASTGGPAALQHLLSGLPADFPVPILIVQHIADGFVDGFANWLNTQSAMKVKIAMHGEEIRPHTVYVAPNDSHLGVKDRATLLLSPVAPIDGFRPAATFLFESVAKVFGSASLHVILTGMGRDGVAGLRTARQVGARIIAQDEASSVVFGMPGAAIEAGLADSILPLRMIPQEFLTITSARE